MKGRGTKKQNTIFWNLSPSLLSFHLLLFPQKHHGTEGEVEAQDMNLI